MKSLRVSDPLRFLISAEIILTNTEIEARPYFGARRLIGGTQSRPFVSTRIMNFSK